MTSLWLGGPIKYTSLEMYPNGRGYRYVGEEEGLKDANKPIYTKACVPMYYKVRSTEKWNMKYVLYMNNEYTLSYPDTYESYVYLGYNK